MGYIAPITNYQLVQYGERDAVKAYDPFRFSPITRISPMKNGKTYDEVARELRLTKPSKRINRMKEKASIIHVDESQISEATGKGTIFNECV